MARFFDFFLFRYKHKDFIEFSQARLTLNFCLIASLFSLLYVLIANLLDFQASVMIMSTLSILFMVLAFLIRYGVPMNVVSFIYLLLSFLSAVVLVYLSGGIYSSILPWLSFIPLVAILLQNKLAAFLWLTICFITTFVFAYLQDQPSDVPVKYNKDYEVWFFAGVYNGLTGIILVLSMIFQKVKDNILKTLEQKNQLISSINIELKGKNEEIISQNQELKQQKEEIVAQREFIEIKNRELLLVQDELNNLIDRLTNTQNRLATREAENRSILNSIYNTQLLVAELNLEGRFIKASKETCEFLQLKESDLLGKSFDEVGNGLKMVIENNITFNDMWREVAEGNSSSHEAMLIINDTEYWITENYFPILDDGGKPNKIMIIAQDISQIKNQQGEIEVLNVDLKENLWKIEQQNDLLKNQQKEIETINKELKESNEAIKNINQNLERRVEKRTKNLELQNRQLSEYAYINAHLLRGPLCSILGLVQLMENGYDDDTETLVFHMKKSSMELQKIINKITKVIEKGSHFGRNLID